MKKSRRSMEFSITAYFSEYKKVFLEENAKLNLVSKNDEKVLFEKHIYDSLAIKLFFEKYKINNVKLLDIGCGGGFPSVPIAIEFPNINVVGIDSIRKKINSINNMKEALALKNLSTICGRVESLSGERFDIITSRAVADLAKITAYALPLLKKNGYFVAYKSKKALEELEGAKDILKKYKAEVVDIINYTLPLEEVYERNLIVIRFAK